MFCLLASLVLLTSCRGQTHAAQTAVTASPAPAGILVPPTDRTLAGNAETDPPQAGASGTATPRAPAARRTSTARPSTSRGGAARPRTAARAGAARSTRSQAPNQPGEPAVAVAAGSASNRQSPSRVARTATAVALPDGSERPVGLTCPATAPVKVSRAHVYHTPASRTYETVKPVICFTTAAAAKAAGYKPAKN